MANTILSDASITQTQLSYTNTSLNNVNKSDLDLPLINKTTGDLIIENKCQLLYIIVIAGITFSILRNNQPDLNVSMED